MEYDEEKELTNRIVKVKLVESLKEEILENQKETLLNSILI